MGNPNNLAHPWQGHDFPSGFTLDLTVSGTEEKLAHLKNLAKSGTPIISDTTCCNGEKLREEIPLLVGAIGGAFFSPTNTYEYWAATEEAKVAIQKLFSSLEVKGEEVSSPGVGFIYPRTVSLIINEAYYALEDKIADSEDIDMAMKYGVSYPQGPLAWARKIGQSKIFLLLNELEHVYKSSRYRPAPGLLG